MTKKMTHVCDECKKVLDSESSMPAKYVLEVSAINVNTNNTGMMYAVAMRPIIKDVLHFCNADCLTSYFSAKKHLEESS